MTHYDIFVIGAGAAGIAAATTAWNAGCRSIAIADRRLSMGGILLQCAHCGFGRDLDGPSFTRDLLSDFPENLTFFGGTTVLSVSSDRIAVLSGPAFGIQKISFSVLILTSGCREIPLGALPVAGTRPVAHIPCSSTDCEPAHGIFTAGQMQELMNIHHLIPQGPAVILGSGDIGLIMAMHLAEAGVEISGIVEQRESCGGMLRNQNRLKGYHMPFLFNTTIREICGYPSLEGVVLQDGHFLPCRTLLIAVGLVSQQELIQEFKDGTDLPNWIIMCGNARQVHPMVDGVVADGARAGKLAYEYGTIKLSRTE